MADRPRLLLPITSAWPVRNFLLSGLLTRIQQHVDVVLAVPESRRGADVFHGWETVALPEVEVTSRHYCHIRQRLGRAHHWIASPKVAATLLRLYRHSGPWWQRAIATLNMRRGRFEASTNRYQWLVAEESRRWRALNAHTFQLASRFLAKFDAVLFPAPHSSAERWLARAAKELRVRTMASIHSFDNPTTTTRHPIFYDHYFVWNKRMALELQRIYPELQPDRFCEVGTPHFQFYFDPRFRGSRLELARRFDLDPSRPVLLFAAGPNALVPHEVPLVMRLCADLRAVPIQHRAQVVIRPHPIERDYSRWDVARSSYPELRWCLPISSTPSDAQWTIPTLDSLRDFCMLVRYSNVVLNCCSTMSIDAAICDTPVVCLNYALTPYEDFAPFMHSYYQWDHYLPVISSGAVQLANRPEQLLPLVYMYIDNPSRDRDGRAKLIRDMCGTEPAYAVQRFADAVLERMTVHVRHI